VQPAGGGAQTGGGEEFDRADPHSRWRRYSTGPTGEVDDAPPVIPYPHPIVEVVGGAPGEVEDGAALERHPHVASARLDARDVAEARHEGPAEIDLMLAKRDLEPEDRERPALLRQLGYL
jgi:hypothetical protein